MVGWKPDFEPKTDGGNANDSIKANFHAALVLVLAVYATYVLSTLACVLLLLLLMLCLESREGQTRDG